MGDPTSVPGSYTGNRRDPSQGLGFEPPPLVREIELFPLGKFLFVFAKILVTVIFELYK